MKRWRSGRSETRRYGLLAGGAGICLAVTGFAYYVYGVINGARWGAMAPSGIAIAGVVLYRVARRAALDRK